MTTAIRSLAVAVAMAAVLSAQGFTTHQLILREGAVPTIDGVPIPATPAYTGAADTYVFKDNPSTNYGTADTLHFFNSERDPGAGEHATRAYLRFDDFTDYLPAGAAILNGTIGITAGGREGAGDPLDVNYRTAAWDESTLTFGTAGSYTANVKNMGGANRNDAFTDGSKPQIDVSSLARQWQSGAIANNGIQLNAREGYNATYPDYLMYSSDHATADNRPQLIIDYIEPDTYTVGYHRFERGARMLQGTSVFEDTVIENSPTNYASETSTGTLQLQNPATPPRPRRGLIKILMTEPSLADLAPTGTPLDSEPVQLVSARLEFNIMGGANRGSLRLATAAQDWTDTVATGAGGTSGNGLATATTEWAQAWDVPLTNYDTNLGYFSYDPAFQAGTQSFDITSIVQSYIDGGDNFGFIFEGNISYGSQWGLTGYSFAHMQPTLVLEVLTVAVPEPASAVLLAAGLLALVRRRHLK